MAHGRSNKVLAILVAKVQTSSQGAIRMSDNTVYYTGSFAGVDGQFRIKQVGDQWQAWDRQAGSWVNVPKPINLVKEEG